MIDLSGNAGVKDNQIKPRDKRSNVIITEVMVIIEVPRRMVFVKVTYQKIIIAN